jgi:hypothetical protein
MATVLAECLLKSRVQLCVLLLFAKRLNAKDIHKEARPVYGSKYSSRKAVHKWVEKFSEGCSNVAVMSNQMRKWLRQQSKDFYAAGFDALVK